MGERQQQLAFPKQGFMGVARQPLKHPQLRGLTCATAAFDFSLLNSVVKR
jgi:hypothetical protein